jgi:protein-tyrosine kinase
MSVIENALEKMRRNAALAKTASGPAAAATAPVPRPQRLASPTTSAAVPPTHVAPRIAINLPQLRAAGYLPEEGEDRRFADYYRAIKRPVIQKALATADASPDLRLILVTSALPCEGKTFTTLNLAFSMAREHDVSVLLVDADIPKSHISRALGVPKAPGLIDALRDEGRDVESFVQRTNVPGLDILPAGGPSEGATELIASARMARVATELSRRNSRRLVLFDSSPVLVSSEARTLVQVPGQIILVARSGQTPQRALRDAVALIDKKKLSGLVLNDAFAGAESDYYGYNSYGDGGPNQE